MGAQDHRDEKGVKQIKALEKEREAGTRVSLWKSGCGNKKKESVDRLKQGKVKYMENSWTHE